MLCAPFPAASCPRGSDDPAHFVEQEANEKFGDAEAVYNALIKETPSNQLAWKRLITLARAQAATKVARPREDADAKVLQLFHDYLESFGSDAEVVRACA